MHDRYEKIIKSVCRLPKWDEAELGEKEGAIGVACVLAYISGVNSSVNDLSRALNISSNDIVVPFRRLAVNGIFSTKYNAREDDVLLGNVKDQESTRDAWCIIAGVAGGFTGLREN